MLSLCKSLVLIAHLGSVHFAPGYNDDNHGAGLECRNGNVSAAVGAYRNSFDENSVYGVFGFKLISLGPVSASAVIGAASGYDDHRKSPVIGGARLTVEVGRAELGALLVPSADDHTGFAHFTLGWRFGE